MMNFRLQFVFEFFLEYFMFWNSPSIADLLPCLSEFIFHSQFILTIVTKLVIAFTSHSPTLPHSLIVFGRAVVCLYRLSRLPGTTTLIIWKQIDADLPPRIIRTELPYLYEVSFCYMVSTPL